MSADRRLVGQVAARRRLMSRRVPWRWNRPQPWFAGFRLETINRLIAAWKRWLFAEEPWEELVIRPPVRPRPARTRDAGLPLTAKLAVAIALAVAAAGIFGNVPYLRRAVAKVLPALHAASRGDADEPREQDPSPVELEPPLLPRFPSEQAFNSAPPAVRRAFRANVLIVTAERTHKPGKPMSERSSGSGVIVRSRRGRATILTNRHVVEGWFCEEPVIEVLSSSGERARARVKWRGSGRLDLAVVECRLRGRGVSAAPVRIGRPVAVGQPAFAVGNPGRLGWTYTEGAISSVRVLKDEGRAVRFIQTQAPIDHGSSGGGLYDREGYLLGINTMREAAGIGFAVSVDNLAGERIPGWVPARAS